MHIEREHRVGKFWFTPVRMQTSGGFIRSEIRRIERIVEEHQELLPGRQRGTGPGDAPDQEENPVAFRFGMKARIGVDSETRIAHSITATAANVQDATGAHNLLREGVYVVASVDDDSSSVLRPAAFLRPAAVALDL